MIKLCTSPLLSNKTKINFSRDLRNGAVSSSNINCKIQTYRNQKYFQTISAHCRRIRAE